MGREFYDNLSVADKSNYERGYHDATREINNVLNEIILQANSSDEVMLSLTGFVLGNEIILSGGTADEAIEVQALLETLAGV